MRQEAHDYGFGVGACAPAASDARSFADPRRSRRPDFQRGEYANYRCGHVAFLRRRIVPWPRKTGKVLRLDRNRLSVTVADNPRALVRVLPAQQTWRSPLLGTLACFRFAA